MPTEIEAKFRLAEPGAVRKRLSELGAQRVAWRLESNHLFDTPDGRLRRSDCGLRIRVVRALDESDSPLEVGEHRRPAGYVAAGAPPDDAAGHANEPGVAAGPRACRGTWATGAALLTFKGPRSPGELKVREELESSLGNAAAVMAILARLGWREVVVYEKRREVWQLGLCEVAVDELPRSGWWLEIEGPDQGAVQEARRVLGLESVAPVHETYVEWAARHGHADADGCRRLTFDATAP